MFALATLVAPLCACPAPPQESVQIDADRSWMEAWQDNLRWVFDVSGRGVVDDRGEITTFGFFGIDLHKVVSTGSRDLVTLTLQPYMTRVDNLVPTPPIFDGPDDWELVWRIFNANVKLRQDGALNLRVGHFELPYGLEQTLNTNGTLRDYTHPVNFGLKADWGATLNGDFDAFEYEFGWSRGSGNEWRNDGDPGIISGRIGTPRDGDEVWGVSFADGDFRTPRGILERSRIALDAQIYRRDLGYFAEVSVGEDGGDTDVVRALGEINWRNSHETVLAWVQLVGAHLDGPDGSRESLTSLIGARWTPSPGWSFSTQYVQVLDPIDDAMSRRGTLALQLRYRF